jgi:hypothetical protein
MRLWERGCGLLVDSLRRNSTTLIVFIKISSNLGADFMKSVLLQILERNQCFVRAQHDITRFTTRLHHTDTISDNFQ